MSTTASRSQLKRLQEQAEPRVVIGGSQGFKHDIFGNPPGESLHVEQQAEPPPRPTKGDPMLDGVLQTPSPEFDAWVKSLPAAYWARYDMSACRIGWEAGRAAKQQQAEPALIGSNLFPSTIRLADGRDVQLGELVRRAAHGLEATQWNLLPQKARDSAMVNALDNWQRGLTTQQQAEPQQSGITAAQVEQIKRLADEYAVAVYTSPHNDKSAEEKARTALHAAIDALKGTP